MVMATIAIPILTDTVMMDIDPITVTGTIIIGVGDKTRGWKRQWVTTQAHRPSPPVEALSTSPWLATLSQTIPESSSTLSTLHSRGFPPL